MTIVGLTVDPFFQATISYMGGMQDVETTEAAGNIPTLPYAQFLDTGKIVGYEPGGAVGNVLVGSETLVLDLFDVQLDIGVSSALYDGFYLSTPNSTSRAQQASFQCSTGNCTWPVFATAAVCSACNDVSSQITRIRAFAEGGNGTDEPVLDILVVKDNTVPPSTSCHTGTSSSMTDFYYHQPTSP